MSKSNLEGFSLSGISGFPVWGWGSSELCSFCVMLGFEGFFLTKHVSKMEKVVGEVSA